jgi:hypothetical protein
MNIAQGQRFWCTSYQDQINEQIRSAPDMPCSEVAITLDNGQFTFECKMGIKIRASGTVTVDNCQLDVQITEGTIGVSEVFQLVIKQLLPNLPYEKVCFDQIVIDDGQMELAGYGR